MADAKRGKDEKPMAVFTKYSPYMLVDLPHLKDARGKKLPVSAVISLCRCGGSQSKPYCDGTHGKIGFIGEKKADRVKDRVQNYVGKDITIHDNRGVCAHDGACSKNLPSVFDMDRRPWINPNGAGVEEIVKTVKKCPSGALSYSLGGRRYQDLERKPSIRVAKNGPLELTGFIAIKDDMNSTPESKEHCTLCRCGESSNRPFCDGTHVDIHFNDLK